MDSSISGRQLCTIQHINTSPELFWLRFVANIYIALIVSVICGYANLHQDLRHIWLKRFEMRQMNTFFQQESGLKRRYYRRFTYDQN